ncbi:hypothetical protein B7463_g3236, partial [Scytalidium lignicola]
MSAEVAQAENVALAHQQDQPSGIESAVKQPDVAAEGNNGNTVTKEINNPVVASSTDQKGNDAAQENGAAAESQETTNGTKTEEKTEVPAAQEFPGSESATAKENVLSSVPEPASALEEKKEADAPAPSHVETNGTDELAPAVQPPPPTSVLPSDETAAAQSGDKRKADELGLAAEPADASKPEENGEHDAKKPKVTEEATQANGEQSAEPVKRKPGRPPKSSNGAAKKEKKVPAVGRSERKTRSQGGLPRQIFWKLINGTEGLDEMTVTG